MRIKRLKLENFIGIKHGMNEDVIEINFTDTPIVMLQGGNGSGKTTILSQLHPFTDSFDDRKKIIEDGKVGLKEIDIEHNGNLYQIQHHYPPGGASKKTFIQKNGEELNSGGRFKEGEAIISRELGITSDYFKIGRIGSNTTNFVDYTSTARKDYISNFISIDDLLDAYKVANTKLKTINEQIEIVSSDLRKLESKDILEVKIKEGEKVLYDAVLIIDELLPKKGSLDAMLTRAIKDIGTQDVNSATVLYNNLCSEYEQSNNDEASLRKSLNLTTDKKETQDKRDAVAADIAECETKIRINNSEQNNLKVLIATQKEKINRIKLNIASLEGDEEQVKILKDKITEYEKERVQIKEAVRSSAMGRTIFDAQREGKNVKDYIEKFRNCTDFIEKYYTDLMKSDTKIFATNLELFLSEECENILDGMVTQTRTSIGEKRKLLDELKAERGRKEGAVCHLDNLSKRPHECNIDTCPFIRDALKYKNVRDEILELDGQISIVSRDLSAMELMADNLTDIISKSKLFTVSYGNLNARDNIIFKYYLGSSSLVEKLNVGLANFQSERQSVISESTEVVSLIEYFSNISQSMTSINAEIEKNRKGDDSLKEKYEQDIEDLNKELTDIQTQLTSKESTGNELSVELNSLRITLNTYDNYLTILCNRDCLATKKSNAKSNLEKLIEYFETKTTCEKELAEVQKTLSENIQTRDIKTDELNRLKVNLGTVENLTRRFKELSEQAEPLKQVTTALDPKAGIPLILIKLYLEETELFANNLLDVAYNGEFHIKFNLTEKDFFIEVNAKENTKTDIRYASQGEIALTTISISLALIQQSIGEYNILCLDETDGPLDAENRENFLNILNSQIKKLGIEQVFVISHNNAFDTAEMDLILLPRHSVDEENTEFMKNKKVIFRYN